MLPVRTLSRIWGILEHVHESVVGRTPHFLNQIFITPDVHRVHHGKNYQYLDKNYSEILSIWDRMFGTYEEYHERPVFGVLKPVNDNSFVDINVSPFKDLYKDLRSVNGFGDRMKILLKKPGWYQRNQQWEANKGPNEAVDVIN